MKYVRHGYVVFVLTLAFAQVFVAFSPWTAPALLGDGDVSLRITCLVALFGAWILAAAADVALGILGILPLSFAGEAVFSCLCLAILPFLDGGIFYFLCAVVPVALIFVKAFEELAGIGKQLKPV
jgi:hypothetical protein